MRLLCALTVIALAGCATKDKSPSRDAQGSRAAIASSIKAADLSLADVEKMLDEAIELNKSL